MLHPSPIVSCAVLAGLAIASGPAFARERATCAPDQELMSRFLHVDVNALAAPNLTRARAAFGTAAAFARRCSPDPDRPSEYVRCLFDALDSGTPVKAVREPSSIEDSTATSVLVRRRGNCAAIAAVILALDAPNAALAPVIFPNHVMLRLRRGRNVLFEPLEDGAAKKSDPPGLTFGPTKEVATGQGFLPYYTDNLAVRLAEAGNAAAAERTFRQAVTSGRRIARVRFNFGTFLLGRSRYPEAIHELRRAVRLQGSNADAWANLGVAHAKVKELKCARRCFEQALRLDPDNEIARVNLALLFRGRSR